MPTTGATLLFFQDTLYNKIKSDEPKPAFEDHVKLLSSDERKGRMNESLNQFIRAYHINSFQKLRLLLLFQRQPHLVTTKTDLVQRLVLGDLILLEALLADLLAVEVLEDQAGTYRLSANPKLWPRLQDLAHAFDDPLTRQSLLDRVRCRSEQADRSFQPLTWRDNDPDHHAWPLDTSLFRKFRLSGKQGPGHQVRTYEVVIGSV
jgi:hypothetical protein